MKIREKYAKPKINIKKVLRKTWILKQKNLSPNHTVGISTKQYSCSTKDTMNPPSP